MIFFLNLAVCMLCFAHSTLSLHYVVSLYGAAIGAKVENNSLVYQHWFAYPVSWAIARLQTHHRPTTLRQCWKLILTFLGEEMKFSSKWLKQVPLSNVYLKNVLCNSIIKPPVYFMSLRRMNYKQFSVINLRLWWEDKKAYKKVEHERTGKVLQTIMS